MLFAYAAVRISMEEYAPRAAKARAPRKYRMLIHHLFEKKPRISRFVPASWRVVTPVVGSNPSPGCIEKRRTQKATDRIGGKVYVNWRMQKAATTDVRHEKLGIPA